MARKKVNIESENNDRWMVSYADFITLLFAFFVVMYSISSVNEGKYRVLSDSLTIGFKGAPRSLEPIQFGTLIRSRALQQTTIRPQEELAARAIQLPAGPVDKPLEPIPLPRELPQEKAPGLRGKADPLDEIYQKLSAYGEDLVVPDLMRIRRLKNWVELELNQSLLFSDASANMRAIGSPVLTEVATLLEGYPNSVHVEGHADSRPIRTSAFPSNWELSAARAASVVNYFVGQGINPARLAAVGYGQFRPIADNETDAGRRRNRRVIIVIHSTSQDRRFAPRQSAVSIEQ
jgi:chemotaxis protein MotB